MSPDSKRLSRLQLAAALLEYDNDPSDPHHTRSHRDSAIFAPFNPRPLDHHPSGERDGTQSGRRYGQQPYRDGNGQETDPGPIQAGVERDADAQRNGRDRRMSALSSGSHPGLYGRNSGEKHPDRGSGSWSTSRRGEGGTEAFPQRQDQLVQQDDIDVSRWGLPDHLVASTSTPPAPAAASAQRSSSGNMAPRVPDPTHTLDDPTLSATFRSRDSFSSPRSHNVSTGINMASSMISGPMNSRAYVHLDLVDGMHGQDQQSGSVMVPAQNGYADGEQEVLWRTDQGNDQYGVDSVLERAERVRRMAESGTAYDASSSTGEGEGRIRTMSSGTHSSSTSTMQGQRSNAESTSILSRPRPNSSLSYIPEPLSTNPVFVPLPASPMGSPLRARPYSSLSFMSGDVDTHRPASETEDPRLTRGPKADEIALDNSPNPFALPPLPTELGSRFDPKTLEAQRRSVSFSGSAGLAEVPGRVSGRSASRTSGIGSAAPYLPPTSPSREQRHPLEPHQGQGWQRDEQPAKIFEDIPTPEQYGRPLQQPKYSNPSHLQKLYQRHRQSHIRPKSLIMPSRLEGQMIPGEPNGIGRGMKVPEGFTLGSKPLPPGARSSILIPMPISEGAAAIGGGGGGESRMRTSESQKTVRASVYMGVRGDDEDDGEDPAGLDGPDEGEMYDGIKERHGRKAGKLYGTSLMDQLEARKAAMKGKQRVFTGDSRPAMMARQSQPAMTSSESHPHLSPPRNDPRHPRQPLLQFDGNGQVISTDSTLPPRQNPGSSENHHGNLEHAPEGAVTTLNERPTDRMTKSKSVFGVDQLWEKEMAKLKIIQDAEAKQREMEQEAARLKEEKERKKKDKGKKKKEKGPSKGEEKDKEGARDHAEEIEMGQMGSAGIQQGDQFSPVKKISDLPPALEYEPEPIPAKPATDRNEKGVLGASVEADDAIARSGVDTQPLDSVPRPLDDGDDSEEDVPLSRIAIPAKLAEPTPPESEDDEEEAVPLSKLRKPSAKVDLSNLKLDVDATLAGTGSLGLSLPGLESTDNAATTIEQPDGGGLEDDDVPLLLRQAHVKATAAENKETENEDDVPLGLKVRQSGMDYGVGFDNGSYQHLNVGMGMGMAMGGGGSAYGSTYYQNPNQHQIPQQYYQQGYGQLPSYPSYYPYAQSNMSAYGINPAMNMYGGPGMGMGMGVAGHHAGMTAYPGMGNGPPLMPVAPMGSPPNERAIDDWRKGVAVAPVSIAGGDD